MTVHGGHPPRPRPAPANPPPSPAGSAPPMYVVVGHVHPATDLDRQIVNEASIWNTARLEPLRSQIVPATQAGKLMPVDAYPEAVLVADQYRADGHVVRTWWTRPDQPGWTATADEDGRLRFDDVPHPQGATVLATVEATVLACVRPGCGHDYEDQHAPDAERRPCIVAGCDCPDGALDAAGLRAWINRGPR